MRREAVEDSREFEAPRRGRRWAVPFSLRPAMAVAGLLVVLAAGIVGYAIGTGGGDDTATIEAQATPQAPRGVRATLERDGDRGTLRVEGLPQKRDGVYEVWLARKGRFEPSSLFQVDSNGSGAAASFRQPIVANDGMSQSGMDRDLSTGKALALIKADGCALSSCTQMS